LNNIKTSWVPVFVKSKIMKIILGTTSPYRIEAFKFLEIDFIAEGSKVDESQVDRNNPEELVKELSKLKAEAVAKNHNDAIVIGMDSVGYFNGKILEKPKSREEGFERLKSLSGNSHQFYTGVHIINTASGKVISKVVKTEIHLRNFLDKEIEIYLNQDKFYNTYALGYDPLGHYSSTFAEKIEGSYNNFLRGIPLEIMPDLINESEQPK
jgi:septum formation protein